MANSCAKHAKIVDYSDMKTKFFVLLVVGLVAILLWAEPQTALAQQVPEAPVPGNEAGGGVLGDWTDVFDPVDVMIQPTGGSSVEAIRNLFYNFVLPQFKYIFAFVALLIWVVYLLTLVGSAGREEMISEQRKNLGWGIAGFVVISLAVDIGNAFAPTNANADIINQAGAEQIFARITAFIQVALTPIAIATVFYAGYKFITANGEEETISSAKKIFQWGFSGLLIAMFAEPLVRTVFYPDSGAPGEGEIESFAQQMVGLLRFILTFLGVLAMASFIVAGGYFVTSFGDEDRHRKAKEIIGGSLLGIVIILSAFALVAVFNPG